MGHPKVWQESRPSGARTGHPAEKQIAYGNGKLRAGMCLIPCQTLASDMGHAECLTRIRFGTEVEFAVDVGVEAFAEAGG